MNDVLREYLDQFYVVYIDDILIYTKRSREKHIEQVKKVLLKLQEAKLFIKSKKCEFFVNKTIFLGFIISEKGIEMDTAKINAILDWETPKNVRDVQCFLGFA